MANVFVEETTLTAIGNAIRSKNGTTELLKPGEMAAAIEGIETGGGGDTSMLDSVIAGDSTTIVSNAKKVRDSAFSRFSTLTDVEFPEATTIEKQAFYSCSNLKSAIFPKVTIISNQAFIDCAKLENISFPALYNVWNEAFKSCTSLKIVKFPVASEIYEAAFQNARGLITADLGVAYTIGNYVFWYCQSLTSLILRRSAQIATLVHVDGLGGTPIASGTGYIYVPRSLVDSYKSATNWSTYASQFRALEDYTVDGTITGALDESKI